MEEEFYLCENEEDVIFIVNYIENKKDVKYYITKQALSESKKELFINLCNFYFNQPQFKSIHTFYISFKDGYLDFVFYNNITNSDILSSQRFSNNFEQKIKSVKLIRRKEKLKQI